MARKPSAPEKTQSEKKKKKKQWNTTIREERGVTVDCEGSETDRWHSGPEGTKLAVNLGHGSLTGSVTHYGLVRILTVRSPDRREGSHICRLTMPIVYRRRIRRRIIWVLTKQGVIKVNILHRRGKKVRGTHVVWKTGLCRTEEGRHRLPLQIVLRHWISSPPFPPSQIPERTDHDDHKRHNTSHHTYHDKR